jgi:hypothetical protein
MRALKPASFAAGFGGVAPTLLNAAISLQANGFRTSMNSADPTAPVEVIVGFAAVLAIMAILGGGVAFALQERR